MNRSGCRNHRDLFLYLGIVDESVLLQENPDDKFYSFCYSRSTSSGSAEICPFLDLWRVDKHCMFIPNAGGFTGNYFVVWRNNKRNVL